MVEYYAGIKTVTKMKKQYGETQYYILKSKFKNNEITKIQSLLELQQLSSQQEKQKTKNKKKLEVTQIFFSGGECYINSVHPCTVHTTS